MAKRRAMMETAEISNRREGLARVSEAADFLAVSASTVYLMMGNGSLPFVKLPGKKGDYARRIPWASLYAMIGRAAATT